MKEKTPDPDARANGVFCYPELIIRYNPDGAPPPISRAFGKMSEPGTYSTTVTQPDFYRHYLTEQLVPLLRDYDVEVEVKRSSAEIPYAYVWDQSQASGLDEINPAELAKWFPAPQLSDIGDEIADGELFEAYAHRPLALFDAPRTDFSLKRLAHYTGTPVKHFQRYLLFTNYHRYVDAFVDWGLEQLKSGGRYKTLSVAGGVVADKDTENARELIDNAPWRRFQMPTYHLTAEDGSGITLVNIGVGPSNAKTITDHLAVLRPECWIMVGHCGGLRHSQAIGDYVLAHAYLRDDHVLDEVLSPDIPIPPIAEVQVALQEASADVTGETGDALKKRLRTGTVVTTDDRNWELRFSDSARRFNSRGQLRSIWKAPPSQQTASGCGCRTGSCCVSRTNRCMARSSCPARRINSMKVDWPALANRCGDLGEIGKRRCKAAQPETPSVRRTAIPIGAIMQDRVKPFENIRNFRDFGGYDGAGGRKVRTGVLFRSAQFGEASEADLTALADYNIKVQADLRRPR